MILIYEIYNFICRISFVTNKENSGEGECMAALRINNTVAMSGEQTIAAEQKILNLPMLYIGGLPTYLIQQLDIPVLNGIIGCMHSLKVRTRNYYQFFQHQNIDIYTFFSKNKTFKIIQSMSYVFVNDQVDGVSKDIYMDAIDGNGITECSSLACISNPCHHIATCIEYGNSWTCICPSG